MKRLGVGASAEVWLAQDTLAANLRVAVKILTARHGMDTYSMHNLQAEFTQVYNLQHQNLLTPTNYAVADGTPYLVLPYCENGSTESMVGRAEEDDLIHVMHDVAAALAQLHSHGIVHQDIKPANILVDDNCNFMVTDFGISTDAAHSRDHAASGTTAYMGPERFQGQATPINMNDIYALGATLYELATGDVPFGEQGGLAQAAGETMPPLPDKLSAEIVSLITRCLQPEPWNRPSAQELVSLTTRRLETGSWREKNTRRPIYIAAAAALVVLMLGALVAWDYYRTKVYYYKDYAEYYSVPKGIGRLTASQVRHRTQSYRMEYSRRLLRRLSLVNPEGKLIPHSDNETMLTRYTDVRFYYTDEGRIDYKAIYDQAGRMLFKMDYDEALKTVTFRQNDEYGTEMNLLASTTDPKALKEQFARDRSRISRYLLDFGADGLLARQRYVGLQNVPACDADRIYGVAYQYDDKGRKVSEQYLGPDSKPTTNATGLSQKIYGYDENDNWSSMTYLAADGQPAHEGNNVQLLKIESDQYGNRQRETYHLLSGQPTLRSDIGAAGVAYDIDDSGHVTTLTLLDIDGQPMTGKHGYAREHHEFDRNGYLAREYYTDADNNPVVAHDDGGDTYSSITLTNNDQGQPLRVAIYDEAGKPAVVTAGHHAYSCQYDSLGRSILTVFYGPDDKPARYEGTYNAFAVTYDAQSNITQIAYLDEKRQPTINSDGVATVKAEWNRQGTLARMAFFDANGKPVLDNELVSSMQIDYDDLGNRKTMRWFDTEGRPTNGISGAARREFGYDTKSNQLIGQTDYDAAGHILSQQQWLYDSRGNQVRSWALNATRQLKKGTAVQHSQYDNGGRLVRRWYTTLADKPCNEPGTNVCTTDYQYDQNGNLTQVTFYATTGKPATDDTGAHKREFRYNDAGQRIYQRDLAADGQPVKGRGHNPEAKMQYDRMGNLCLIECYDGHGKPRLTTDGYFRMTATYNSQGKEEQRSYYGLDGKLTKSREQEFAQRKTQYNSHGDETLVQYYGTDGRLFRQDCYTYNERNRTTSLVIKNAAGKQDDSFWGFSRLNISYDDSKLIPLQRDYYNAAGRKLGYSRFDPRTRQWGQLVGTQVGQFNAMGTQWKQTLAELARQCPMDTANGITILSVSISSESVVCTLKLSNITMSQMDTDAQDAICSNLRGNVPAVKKMLGVPKQVQFSVVAYDSEGQRII